MAAYPHITVPAGFVFGLPIGVWFFASAYSAPALIRLAYAVEQATKARKPPKYLPTEALGLGVLTGGHPFRRLRWVHAKR